MMADAHHSRRSFVMSHRADHPAAQDIFAAPPAGGSPRAATGVCACSPRREPGRFRRHLQRNPRSPAAWPDGEADVAICEAGRCSSHYVVLQRHGADPGCRCWRLAPALRQPPARRRGRKPHAERPPLRAAEPGEVLGYVAIADEDHTMSRMHYCRPTDWRACPSLSRLLCPHAAGRRKACEKDPLRANGLCGP